MTDIAERLRARSARSQGGMDKLDDEAADEIELLRAEVEMLRAHRDSLMVIVARQAEQKLENEH